MIGTVTAKKSLDCEQTLFRFSVRRAWRERKSREKKRLLRELNSWRREARSSRPRISLGHFLFSWFSFTSRTTDWTKVGLLLGLKRVQFSLRSYGSQSPAYRLIACLILIWYKHWITPVLIPMPDQQTAYVHTYKNTRMLNSYSRS